MKTYFISSDIHSFYDEYRAALKKQKFDINNPEHIIVVLGDIFDRGEKPLEVYNFLKSLPKERRILIRGNHEVLLRDLLTRGWAENHDNHNGTYDTLFLIAGLGSKSEFNHEFYVTLRDKNISFSSPEYNQLQLEHDRKWRQIWKGEIKDICNWMFSDEWVNYYETTNYIFVHAWIPLLKNYEFDKWYMPHQIGPDSYREDWRNATDTEWEDAMWYCPWQKAKEKLNQTGKIIVCGHWHTSDFFNMLTKQEKTIDDNPIFKSKKYKLIGLDACTVISHKVNVLKLTEEEL